MSRRLIRFAGFTLVEVMLTTVLAAVLLVGLWSLLSMYSKAFESGHARTEQSQLARALLEQMSTDLQSVLVAPPPALPAAERQPSDVGLTPASTASVTSPVQPIAPISAVVPAAAPLPQPLPSSAAGNGGARSLPIGGDELLRGGNGVATSSLRPAGLFGTTTFLQIDVVQPAFFAAERELDEQVVVDPEVPPGADELKTVLYSFAAYRNPANSLAEPETRLVRRELNWAQAHPARDVDRAEVASNGDFARCPSDGAPRALDSHPSEAGVAPPDEPRGSDEESPAQFATTVPEVLDFALRYFDGAVWSDEWDSVSRQGLPAAIEVSLRLRSLEEVAAPTTDDPSNKPGVDQEKVKQWRHPLHRLLIPLTPASKSFGVSSMQRVPLSSGVASHLEAETHVGFDQ